MPSYGKIGPELVSMKTISPTSKENRGTEGCAKLKRSVDMTSSGKNGLNIRTNASQSVCLVLKNRIDNAVLRHLTFLLPYLLP